MRVVVFIGPSFYVNLSIFLGGSYMIIDKILDRSCQKIPKKCLTVLGEWAVISQVDNATFVRISAISCPILL